MYLFLRLMFLQNDGTNPVMLNRWEVRFDFMEKVNTFKINPWPMEAEPNLGLQVGIPQGSDNQLCQGHSRQHLPLHDSGQS